MKSCSALRQTRGILKEGVRGVVQLDPVFDCAHIILIVSKLVLGLNQHSDILATQSQGRVGGNKELCRVCRENLDNLGLSIGNGDSDRLDPP